MMTWCVFLRKRIVIAYGMVMVHSFHGACQSPCLAFWASLFGILPEMYQSKHRIYKGWQDHQGGSGWLFQGWRTSHSSTIVDPDDFAMMFFVWRKTCAQSDASKHSIPWYFSGKDCPEEISWKAHLGWSTAGIVSKWRIIRWLFWLGALPGRIPLPFTIWGLPSTMQGLSNLVAALVKFKLPIKSDLSNFDFA